MDEYYADMGGDVLENGTYIAEPVDADNEDFDSVATDAADVEEEMPDTDETSVVPEDEEPINSNVAEVDTTVPVNAGDRVVMVLDSDGMPTVIGVVGEGDNTAADVARALDGVQTASTAAANAEQAATAAASAASAVSQHFYSDSAGVHVVTAEGDASTGANMLANSQGVLLRNGSNVLSAQTPNGFAVYDGSGTAAANVVASFASGGAAIGKSDAMQVLIDSDSVDFAFHGGSGSSAYTSTASLAYDSVLDRVNLEGGAVYLSADRSAGLHAFNSTSSGFATTSIGAAAAGNNADATTATVLVSHSSGTRTYESYGSITPFAATLNTGTATLDGNMVVNGTVKLTGTNSICDEDGGSVLIPKNANSNTIVGYARYNNQDGNTHVYGNNVNMYARNRTNIASGSFAIGGTLVEDFVVERGSATKGNCHWYYQLFNSGRFIAWGYVSASVTATTAWGSLYYGTIAAQTLPFTCSAAPYETVNFIKNGYFFPVSTADANTTTKTAAYYAVCPTRQSTARTIWVEYIVCGFKA